jgi:signal transduction histidine kinase
LLGVIALALIVEGWFTYRYIKMQSKAKLERLESENREKILNATIDGKESERKMIAEDLHHSVSTLLSSANLHLQAIKMQLEPPYPEEIEKTQKIVNEAADEIRSLSHTLISSVLLKFGLSYAIQELVDKHSHKSLQITCSCENVTRYSDEFELRIYHIIAELINNIIKHSKATQAKILVKQTSFSFLIKVKDNGNGFKQKKGFTGIGLGQIKTRISQMKGSLEIQSDSNSGTEIIIHIPLNQIQEKTRNYVES